MFSHISSSHIFTKLSNADTKKFKRKTITKSIDHENAWDQRGEFDGEWTCSLASKIGSGDCCVPSSAFVLVGR